MAQPSHSALAAQPCWVLLDGAKLGVYQLEKPLDFGVFVPLQLGVATAAVRVRRRRRLLISFATCSC